MKNFFEESFLSELKKKIQQKIKDEDDQQCIFQQLKKINDKKIIESIINKEFNTIEEFFDIKKEYQMKSQTNEGDQHQMKIKNLFEQYQSLNKEIDKEIYNQLCQVYNSLLNPHFLQADFEKSPILATKDLVVLCNKVMQHFSYYPKPVQLLSVIELYNHKQNQGRLAEIYTGEGKTLIVAMLAILLCSKKQINVDIVTSSPVLAIRDAKQSEQFYKLCKITVAHNIRESQNEEDMTERYKSQIIYGDSHSFQADILRQEFQKVSTMGDRKTQYVIVDEVDSMLIDGNGSRTQISSSTPGMQSPTNVLYFIWHQLCQVKQNSSNKKFLCYQDGNFYEANLEEYLYQKVNKLIQEILKNTLSDHQLDYVNFSLKVWIKNAIRANFELQENVHYVLDPDVRITDYMNTGVIHEKNTQWQNGLHQFLQFKHKIPVSPLRISTNFLSNVGFFRKYKIILGLTDCVFLPPDKKRLFKEYPGITTLTKEDWLAEILKAVQQEKDKKRSVLIINQTIQDVQEVKEYLAKNNLTSITYIDNKKNLKKNILPLEIIIATNLAGRGTDLITNEELDRNGGLHVIMTFLPRNIRIQHQGFGRTSRQGKPGTAQLILQVAQDFYIGNIDGIKNFNDAIVYYLKQKQQRDHSYFNILIYFRDQYERYHVDNMEKEMKKLYNEDKCFQVFQESVNNIDRENNYEDFKIKEEKFGRYFERNQENGLKEEEVKELINEKNIQNARFHVLEGIKQNDGNKFAQAHDIQNNISSTNYYKAVFGLQSHQLKKEEAQQYLNQAREQLQMEIIIKDLQIQFVKEEFDEETQSNTEETDLTIPKVSKDQKIPNLSEKNNNQQQSNQTNSNNQQQSNQTNSNNQQQSNQTNSNHQQQSNQTNSNHQQQSNQTNSKIPNSSQNNNNQQQSNQTNSNNQQQSNQTNSKIPNSSQNNNNQQQSNQTNSNNQQQSNQNNHNQQRRNQNNYAQKEKLNNQKKIYQKIIDNIDDILNYLEFADISKFQFSWVPTIDINNSADQCMKDQLEIVEDGPFPQIVKIHSEENSKWWEYLGLFSLGTLEIILGTVATVVGAFTLGYTFPLAAGLITSGIQDAVLAIVGYFKNININWNAWCQKTLQMLTYCIMPSYSMIEKVNDICLSFAKISLAEYLIQIPPISRYQLANAFSILCDEDKIIIQNLRQTLILILKGIINPENAKSKILQLAKNIIDDQQGKNAITKIQASDIYQLVEISLSSSGAEFENNFCEFAQKYIQLQINICVEKKNDMQIKQDFVDLCKKQGKRKIESVEDAQKISEQKKKELFIFFEHLEKNLWECFGKDETIQKSLLTQQIFVQLCYDINNFQEKITYSQIWALFTQQYYEQYQQHKIKLKQKILEEPKNINYFYNNIMQPSIQNALKSLFINLKDQLEREPFEIQFEFNLKQVIDEKQQKLQVEKKILIEQQKSQDTQQKRLQFKQKVEKFNQQSEELREIIKNISNLEKIIKYLKNNKMINNDGITFKSCFQEELNKYMIKEQFKPPMKELLLQTLMNIPSQIQEFQKTEKQFEKNVRKAIQEIIICEYKNQILQIYQDEEEMFRKLIQ